ncbi:MAG: LytTR family DNA-binding domain-containing protein [Bacteroidales bacterium]|jgi:two-component system LytT family response regulator
MLEKNRIIKAMIVDDEIHAHVNIKKLLNEYFPSIQLVAECISAKEAIKEIQRQNPDLLFLDVNMPEMTGFKMLEIIPERNFDVIFITAYDEFAIKAFKVNAIDYILKPIDSNEFITSLNKYVNNFKQNENREQFENRLLKLKENIEDKISFPTFDGKYYVMKSDIICVEAEGSYSKVILKGGENLMVSKNIKEIEELLIDKIFFRVHRSTILNINYIKTYNAKSGEICCSDNKKIYVSRRCKKDFNKLLAEFDM